MHNGNTEEAIHFNRQSENRTKKIDATHFNLNVQLNLNVKSNSTMAQHKSGP